MEITYREDLKPSDIDQVQPLVESSGFFSPEEISIAIELVEERLSKGTRMFYSRCGYRKEAFVNDFYKPGDGKSIYVKAIQPERYD
jgi:hypothetical protein